MANVTRTIVADFGLSYSGMGSAQSALIGYRLFGGARVTAGITEVVAGWGMYQATVTYPQGSTGTLVWDSGDGSPPTARVLQNINPSDADAAPDPLATAVPGAYAPGTLGRIVGSQGGVPVTGTVQAGSTTTAVLVALTGGTLPVSGGVWNGVRNCLFLSGQLASGLWPIVTQSAPASGVVTLTFGAGSLPVTPAANDLIEVF